MGTGGVRVGLVKSGELCNYFNWRCLALATHLPLLRSSIPWPGSHPSFLLQKLLSRGGGKFSLQLKRPSPFLPPFLRKMASSPQIPRSTPRIQNQPLLPHIHTLHRQADRNTNLFRQGVPILNPFLPFF